MFYRRKVILALLQLFNGQLDKIRLQKLLFLFTKKQTKAEYDFVPYRFGCYSYSANADMTAMVKHGQLDEDEKYFTKKDKADFLKLLKPDDKKLILQVRAEYGMMDANALMKFTYLNYPFYAINSVKAESLLSRIEFEKVTAEKPRNDKTILFTIGYEGISLEEYLIRLLKNDVKVLVDVRRNPLSMKYGFSKSLLKSKCESLGVQYIHIPDVGIPGELRIELNSQNDYDNLFSLYKKNNLPQTKGSQKTILDLLVIHKRVALTCFESDICQCHRKPLAEAIEKLSTFAFELKHI